MKSNLWRKLAAALVTVNGILCLLYTDSMLTLLPTVSAGVILANGLTRFIQGVKNRDYASLEGVDMERSLVAIAIGAGILVMQDEALFIVGMFWGLSGLLKAAESLNRGLYNKCAGKKYLLILFKAAVEFTLSLMLIFDPFTAVGHHVVLLGLELIFEGGVELFTVRRDALAQNPKT